jgi:hypothetical protein
MREPYCNVPIEQFWLTPYKQICRVRGLTHTPATRPKAHFADREIESDVPPLLLYLKRTGADRRFDVVDVRAIGQNVIGGGPAVRNRLPTIFHSTVGRRYAVIGSTIWSPTPIPHDAETRDVFAALLQETKGRKRAPFDDYESHTARCIATSMPCCAQGNREKPTTFCKPSDVFL